MSFHLCLPFASIYGDFHVETGCVVLELVFFFFTIVKQALLCLESHRLSVLLCGKIVMRTCTLITCWKQ